MGQHTEIYQREKLYEEVWKEPVLIVARRYGVSDVALAKAYRKLAVPLPPRGYWARVRAGWKAAPPPPLSPYESLARIQTTPGAPRKSVAEASKVTDEKGEYGRAISAITVPETSNNSSRTERKSCRRYPKSTQENRPKNNILGTAIINKGKSFFVRH